MCQNQGMFAPRFSLRWLFGIVAAFGVVFMIAAYGSRGEFWAIGVTAAFVSTGILVVFHALAYVILSYLSRLSEWGRHRRKDESS